MIADITENETVAETEVVDVFAQLVKMVVQKGKG
jgi:hypothetical protein